jgi:PIN domain nuclease of toxin-antitoxin system
LRFLLDTAVLIFAVQAPERLSKRAVDALKNPENVRELSSISLTEIAVKTSLEKLNFPAEMARQGIADMLLHILPFTAEHAFQMFALPCHHRDPFDRQIIAQALYEQIPVITPDQKFRLYDGVKIIW